MPVAPEAVALYLTALAQHGHKVSTIQRRLTAISQVHQAAGHETPTKAAVVRETHKGIRRTLGTRQEGKTPTLTADVRATVEGLPDTLAGRRDRALLLLGFAGAFRRSELVGLDVGDVEQTRDGLVVTLRRSKTDQEGLGRAIGIPYGSNPAS